MKRGFVLIEVLITSLIAAFISMGLLTTIFQISRLQETVQTIAGMYGRVAIVKHQFERDVMGAFIPTQVDMLKTSTDSHVQQAKPLDKIFYGTSSEKRLDLFTFITSNPMPLYFGVKGSKLKPRVARVVYRLIPDVRRKNSFTLMRQEGTEHLVFDLYKRDVQGDMRAYAVIDGIKTLSIQYATIEQPAKDVKKPSKPVYKKVYEWDSQKKHDTAKQPAKPVDLPEYIEVDLELWDAAYKEHRPFSMIVPIMIRGQQERMRYDLDSGAAIRQDVSDTVREEHELMHETEKSMDAS